jgi:hypothetical protein
MIQGRVCLPSIIKMMKNVRRQGKSLRKCESEEQHPKKTEGCKDVSFNGKIMNGSLV